MKSFILLCLFGWSLGKICTYEGGDLCAFGCQWNTPSLWRDCEGGFPSGGDSAVIEASGTYRIVLAENLELESLILGNEDENGTQMLELADRTTLTVNADSQISSRGLLQLGSVSMAGGAVTLRNYGTIVSRGENTKLAFHMIQNYGHLLIRSGKMIIDSNLEHHGSLNVSNGEELELSGVNTFLNGKVFVGVDRLNPNPLVVRGSLTFGDSAVYLVHVYGASDSEYPHIQALDYVSLGGVVKVKLMHTFSPSKHVELSFLSSQFPMAGIVKPQLDVEEWSYPYCIRCQIVQSQKSVGFRCNPCPDESEDVTVPRYSSWSLPDPRLMSIRYLVPGLALVFMIIVLVMGFVELWVRVMERREEIRAVREELVGITME